MKPTAIYNAIGNNYNKTRRADTFIVQHIKELLMPQKELSYIDIGCGTGNYTTALYNSGVDIQGVDPSETMLLKAGAKNNKISWTIGTAENLPFKDDYFSGAIATLTIHHWHDLKQSFKEIYRVLKPRSNFIIFTAAPEQLQNYWLLHYFPVMMQKSIKQMPPLGVITDAASCAGFKFVSNTGYAIADDLQDLFLYSGKNNPALYLDARVRENISSFANLANKNEIDQGINRLSADIISGHFEAVKNKFDPDKDDYTFLKLSKL